MKQINFGIKWIAANGNVYGVANKKLLAIIEKFYVEELGTKFEPNFVNNLEIGAKNFRFQATLDTHTLDKDLLGGSGDGKLFTMFVNYLVANKF